MTALAQMTMMTVCPNHSGWDSAGCYTPHHLQFSRALCKCGAGKCAPEAGLQPNSSHPHSAVALGLQSKYWLSADCPQGKSERFPGSWLLLPTPPYFTG